MYILCAVRYDVASSALHSTSGVSMLQVWLQRYWWKNKATSMCWTLDMTFISINLLFADCCFVNFKHCSIAEHYDQYYVSDGRQVTILCHPVTVMKYVHGRQQETCYFHIREIMDNDPFWGEKLRMSPSFKNMSICCSKKIWACILCHQMTM